MSIGDEESWAPTSVYDAEGPFEEPDAVDGDRRRQRTDDLRDQIATWAPMAAADAALARLDEKLAASGAGAALAERIAAAEAEALGWGLGWRGRPGDSALRFRYAAVVEDEVDGWTRWAARFLSSAASDDALKADPIEMLARLRASGWRRLEIEEVADGAEAARSADPGAEAAVAAVLEAARDAAVLGPSARGALSYLAWSGAAGHGGETGLTGAATAMRFGAGGGHHVLRFTPVALAARRRHLFEKRGDAQGFVIRWCEAVAEACVAHGRHVDDVLRWRDDAQSVETTRIGRAVISLLMLKREIMSEDVAHATGATQQAVNHRLRAMRDVGLVTQTSEGRRFRRWTAGRLRGAPTRAIFSQRGGRA